MQITVCSTAPVAQHTLQRFSFFLFSLQICMEAAQSVASVSESYARERGSCSTGLTLQGQTAFQEALSELSAVFY